MNKKRDYLQKKIKIYYIMFLLFKRITINYYAIESIVKIFLKTFKRQVYLIYTVNIFWFYCKIHHQIICIYTYSVYLILMYDSVSKKKIIYFILIIDTCKIKVVYIISNDWCHFIFYIFIQLLFESNNSKFIIEF